MKDPRCGKVVDGFFSFILVCGQFFENMVRNEQMRLHPIQLSVGFSKYDFSVGLEELESRRVGGQGRDWCLKTAFTADYGVEKRAGGDVQTSKRPEESK